METRIFNGEMDTNPDLERLFRLEKEIDMRKAFIELNKESSSETVRSRIIQFRNEIKQHSIELIELRRKLS